MCKSILVSSCQRGRTVLAAGRKLMQFNSGSQAQAGAQANSNGGNAQADAAAQAQSGLDSGNSNAAAQAIANSNLVGPQCSCSVMRFQEV